MSLDKPRFRRDLEAVPLEVGGQKYVELHDPNTGASFQLYDFEYRVALAFDGLAFDKVISWMKLVAGMDLRESELREFATRLGELGFLEDGAEHQPARSPPAPVEVPAREVPAASASAQASEPAATVAVEAIEKSPPPPEPEPEAAPPPEEAIVEAAPAPAISAEPGSGPAEMRQPDSTAFPVLPTPSPRAVDPSPSLTASAPEPARPAPQPRVTPPPVTLGPLLASQRAAVRTRQRRSLLLFGSLGVLAAAALLAIVVPFFFPTRDPPRAEVRTLAALPATIFRYFAGAGAVSAPPGPLLKFPAPGKVTRIATAGSAVADGDVVAAVEAARPLQNQLAHQRERMAFHQQIAEAMHQVGNTREEERQSAIVEVRKARIAKTLRALNSVAVVASIAGAVEETFAREGDTVEAGSLALRLRSAGYLATFELSRGQAAEARRLGFCRVEIEGMVLDCTRGQERGDETHFGVEIASLPQASLGRPARLARARFDGAVALPASAILNAGRRQQVLVVSPRGRVEARPVTVAEQDTNEAIVIQGLDSGENVILEPSPGLRVGAQVSVRP
jgi:biotin carboxyl carrier protein